MAGNKKRKIKKRKLSIPVESVPPPLETVHPPADKPPSKTAGNIRNIAVGFAAMLAVLASISEVRNWAKDLFYTQHEKYEQETFEQGDLKPPPINSAALHNEIKLNFTIDTSNSYPEIKGILLKRARESKANAVGVGIGRMMAIVDVESLYKGVDILHLSKTEFANVGKNTVHVDYGCIPNKVILGVLDERLYVSVEFKDLDKEETIGVIEFNHWKLYRPNLFDYTNNDSTLEVIDKQNNVVFSVRYVSAGNCVWIKGYLIGAESIYIMPGDITLTNQSQIKSGEHLFSEGDKDVCIPKSDKLWKQKAQIAISSIKPSTRLK